MKEETSYFMADKRINKASNVVLKLLAAPVNTARKVRALCAKVIPIATYGMQWAAPSIAMARKLRSQSLKCMWGISSKMRCAEVVIGILHDPTRVDHTYAAAYRAI